MYRLAVLVLLILTSVPGSRATALAQSPFKGRVVDARTSKPVPGATVTLSGFPGTARTDANGEFTLGGAPAPPFQVVVILPGGTVARPVQIKTVDASTVDVPVDALAGESVTVLGAAPSVTVAPAAGTSLLSSAQISRRAPENLMQALETVPGVNVVS